MDKSFFGREPAMVLGLLNAAIALGTTFGLNLSSDQIGSIMAFSSILLAVITRQSVVPVPTYTHDVEEALYTKVPVQPDLITEEAKARI